MAGRARRGDDKIWCTWRLSTKWSVKRVQGHIGVAGGRKGIDGDRMLILVDDRRGDWQAVPLLKRANVTAETAGMQSMVDTACKECARKAVLRALKACASGQTSSSRGTGSWKSRN